MGQVAGDKTVSKKSKKRCQKRMPLRFGYFRGFRLGNTLENSGILRSSRRFKPSEIRNLNGIRF
jgi:hypothetical protein